MAFAKPGSPDPGAFLGLPGHAGCIPTLSGKTRFKLQSLQENAARTQDFLWCEGFFKAISKGFKSSTEFLSATCPSPPKKNKQTFHRGSKRGFLGSIWCPLSWVLQANFLLSSPQAKLITKGQQQIVRKSWEVRVWSHPDILNKNNFCKRKPNTY